MHVRLYGQDHQASQDVSSAVSDSDRREMLVPLTHSPNRAQVDVGEALADIGGVERKIHFLAIEPTPLGRLLCECRIRGRPRNAFCDRPCRRGSTIASTVCRARSFMTIYQDREWPASSDIEQASEDDENVQARLTIPLPVRGPLWQPRQVKRPGQGRGISSAIAAGTSWCRCQGSGTSMISTRILKPAAPSDGRNNCVATTRRSANAWNGIVRFFSAFPQVACEACDKGTGRFSSQIAGALSRDRLRQRDRDTVRPLRGAGPRLCPRGGHPLRRRGDCQRTRVHTSKRTSSIRFTICPGRIKRPTRWIRRLPWHGLDVAAGVRRSPPPPREERIGKAGKREYVEVLPLIESFSIDDVRAAISGGAGARRDRLRCGQASGAVPDREAAATLGALRPMPFCRAPEVATTIGQLIHGAPEGGGRLERLTVTDLAGGTYGQRL